MSSDESALEAVAALRALADIGDGVQAAEAAPQAEVEGEADAGAERDRLAYLLDRLPAVTFSAEIRGGLREVFISRYLEKLLGYTPSEWLSSPILWYQRLHPEERERWNVEFARVLALGETVEATYRFMARDDSVRWIRGSVSIQRDSSGAPRYVQGVAVDVTEQMLAQQEVERTNALLEEQMEQTSQANEELTRANDELRNLAYVTAHDLKAPARGIAHHLEWVEEELLEEVGELSPAVREHLGKMRVRTQRMQDMIQGLLAYSRIGLTAPQLEHIDLRQFLEQIFEDLSDETPMRMRCECRVSSLNADPAELRMVLSNLISNAKDHHPAPDRGLVEVLVEPDESPVGRRASADRRRARFVVTDNGAGIDPQHHVRVFEMYRSLTGGTGIGLSMVKKAVELKGGKVELTSEPGAGATFVFTWPLGPELEADEHADG